MQIQQNSFLQSLQVMWLQPWFFSMRVLQLGHFLVLARIQLAVSDSDTHFASHSLSCKQLMGLCASSPHLKQNGWLQLQRITVCRLPRLPGTHTR
jgi:hypothetical protein